MGVYGVAMPPERLRLFSPIRDALLRRRIRHELKRLKAEHEKLRQAMRQADAMKEAIARWSRKDQ